MDKFDFLFEAGQRCAYHSMCRSGHCRDGRCRETEKGSPCLPNHGCPPQYYCHPENHHCLHELYLIPERCSGTRDCPWGDYCAAGGKCQRRRETGASCSASAPCNWEAVCYRGTCVQRCLADLDCPDPSTECRAAPGLDVSACFKWPDPPWHKVPKKVDAPKPWARSPDAPARHPKARPKPPKVGPRPQREEPQPVVAEQKPQPPEVEPRPPGIVRPPPPASPSFVGRVARYKELVTRNAKAFARENYVAMIIIGVLAIILLFLVGAIARKVRASRRRRGATRKAAAGARAAAPHVPPIAPPTIYTTVPTSPDCRIQGSGPFGRSHAALCAHRSAHV